MNTDRIAGNWKQLKGKIKEKWGKLTDDDLRVIEGKQDQLAGRLQERYGFSQEEARQEPDQFYDDCTCCITAGGQTGGLRPPFTRTQLQVPPSHVSCKERCNMANQESSVLDEVSSSELIALLNDDLAREYQAIIAYVVYSKVLKGAQFMNI